MSVSSRDLLKMGLMAAPGLSLARLAEAQVGDNRSPPIFPFTRALSIPPVLSPSGGPPGQDGCSITMQEATADIIPGLPTPVWADNDI